MFHGWIWYFGSSWVFLLTGNLFEHGAACVQLAVVSTLCSSSCAEENWRTKNKQQKPGSKQFNDNSVNLLHIIMIFSALSFHTQVCSKQRVPRCRTWAEAGRPGPVWGGSLRSGQVLGGGQAARRFQEAVHQQPLKGRIPRQETQEGVRATSNRVRVGQLLACSRTGRWSSQRLRGVLMYSSLYQEWSVRFFFQCERRRNISFSPLFPTFVVYSSLFRIRWAFSVRLNMTRVNTLHIAQVELNWCVCVRPASSSERVSVQCSKCHFRCARWCFGPWKCVDFSFTLWFQNKPDRASAGPVHHYLFSHLSLTFPHLSFCQQCFI